MYSWHEPCNSLASNHIQPDWFLGSYLWTVSVVKDVSAFLLFLLAAMAFATNSINILDANKDLHH